MPRPSLRAALALAAATLLTVTACATQINGSASTAAGQRISSGTSSTTSTSDSSSTSRTSSSTSRSSSSSSRTTTSTTSSDDPTELPTDFPTDLPTDFPTDLPTDFPTDIPTDFGFSTELPASWPAGLKFPDNTTINFVTSDDSGTSVIFESPVTVADFDTFMEGELATLGYTAVSNDGYQGLLSASYTDGTNDVSLTGTDDGSSTSGIVILGPHT